MCACVCVICLFVCRQIVHICCCVSRLPCQHCCCCSTCRRHCNCRRLTHNLQRTQTHTHTGTEKHAHAHIDVAYSAAHKHQHRGKVKQLCPDLMTTSKGQPTFRTSLLLFPHSYRCRHQRLRCRRRRLLRFCLYHVYTIAAYC